MKTRNVDENHDWTYGQSLTNYVTDSVGVAVDLKMSILEWYTDCFFNLQAGIPWKTRLGAKSQKENLDRDIVNIANSKEEILNITDFQSNVQGRHYSCSFNIYTIYSQTSLPFSLNTSEFINA